MALKERTVINRCEVLASKDIQVREANEFYDDSIIPKDAVDAIYEEQEIESYIAAEIDENGIEIIPAKEAIKGMVEISPYQPAITDIKSQSFHRYVIASDDETPMDIQIFLDNSKKI